MSTDTRGLIPIGFFASFGAPVSYVTYALVTNLIGGRDLDVRLLVSMFAAALIFSFLATMSLVLVTVITARLLRLKQVNVPLLSSCVVIGTSLLVGLQFGAAQAQIFALLAASNLVIAVAISRSKRKKLDTRINSDV